MDVLFESGTFVQIMSDISCMTHVTDKAQSRSLAYSLVNIPEFAFSTCQRVNDLFYAVLALIDF
jgi:hypothetical protein